MNEVIVRLNKKFISKILNGYPLIEKDAIINKNKLKNEGDVLKLVDHNNKFVAKAYYGKQNKGIGWILTLKENKKIDYNYFRDKIAKAISFRKKMYNDNNTTAFRVFNGEGDGIGGLTIDYYDGYYLINWYSEGIYRYKNQVVKALNELTEFKGIYQKKRFKTGGKYIDDDDFICGKRGEFPIIVKENGVDFAVCLNEGAMVGFFLDQREVRKTIKENYAKGKTVLNTFSYTGAFSVFCAMGGAKKTTSVDLANRSKEKTIEQFSINDIDYYKHDIIVEDIFNYFKYAAKKQLKFDMVILDPPSFAKSKKYTFSASKDYKDLLKQAIAITKEKGTIVASTNCSSFNMDKFLKFINDAFKETSKRYKIVEKFSLPTDFKTIKQYKEGDYLKVVFIEIN
ncbi:class I SAM-dependent rRNA methyltransferase [Abyssisolibacter fermentans]|uniref:class I SAM-dependent rRNA methyltransferase n=1 Tax=Abyssisolibacter fermentans TaxID=1766203 RepID=UPI000833FA5B|nr:class I SAM-dependent rRNA methyltransferase [Abyssisolibacter fermentans]